MHEAIERAIDIGRRYHGTKQAGLPVREQVKLELQYQKALAVVESIYPNTNAVDHIEERVVRLGPIKPTTQRITLWGVVEAWLAQHPLRAVIISSGAKGLFLVATDPTNGKITENVKLHEEPSRAAVRAIQRFGEPEAVSG